MSAARLLAVQIKGFKSFARETRLDFGSGLTAVIGPNGSGKSNLAEAVRWVLGEQSAKQLRAKERVDVIFAGEEGQGQAQKAVVALTFDNTEAWFPLEATEVEIRRELTRSGESNYVLNGEPIRLLDLQQLLAEAGIGAKSFTVISQGMVDRYLTASAAERAELFDEATGVKGLQMQLQQAERKLEATAHHAQDIQMVLEELQPRLTVLERQMTRERERQELEKLFEGKQALWLKQEWQRRNQQLTQATMQLQGLQETIASARRERERAEKALVLSARREQPSEELRRQLWQAEAVLRQEEEAFAQRKLQRAEIESSLQKIDGARREAEQALEAARAALAAQQGVSGWRAVVTDCVALLRRWKQGEPFDEQAVDSVLKAAKQALSEESREDMADYRELAERLEGPLQKVTQLTTLQTERERQLQALPALTEPDKTKVEQLQAQLRQLPKEEVNQGSSEALAAAREAELTAEREGSAAEAAVEASNRELHELEDVVLRERGSEFWQQIQGSGEQRGDEQPVSIEELRALEQRMGQLGEIDPLAKKEYEEVRARQEELAEQLADIEQTEANIRQLKSDLTAQVQTQFQQQLEVITQAFSDYFVQLFGGGKAELAQQEDGIEITVRPPGKRALHMMLLSGGERALTSLALLLAILEASAPPFIVLDEVDAALDEANSRRLARIIREKSTQTQCIMITHNRESMARAERLYGVTMQDDGISKVYSVKLSDLPAEGEKMAQERTIGI